MTLTAEVYDLTTNQPVPSASVSVVNSNGNALGGGAIANASGTFTITSSLLDSGAQLLVTSVGYQPVIADPYAIQASGNVGLIESAQTLPAAVVTPGSGSGSASTNYLPYLLGGAALLFLLWPGKKKKSIGDVGFDYTKLAITGGVLVGGYFAGKAILQKLGILTPPNPTTVATTSAQAASLAAAQTAAAASGTGKASYTTDQYTGWANDIFTQGYGMDLSQDTMNTVVNDVTNVNNMVDLQSLISAFGVRQASCGIFGTGCSNYDLPTFLKLILDSFHIDTINQYLAAQNINYTF
jgi:hypothetical protein